MCLQCGRPGFDPWIGKIPWRRKWQPTPVFLPGEFHGQRSLVGYGPWGHKESDMTEWLTMLLNIFCFYWIFIFLFLYECPILCSLPICFMLVLFFVRTLSHLPCLYLFPFPIFFMSSTLYFFIFWPLKSVFIAEHRLCSPNAVVLILTGQL